MQFCNAISYFVTVSCGRGIWWCRVGLKCSNYSWECSVFWVGLAGWCCSLVLPVANGWHSVVGSRVFEVVMYMCSYIGSFFVSDLDREKVMTTIQGGGWDTSSTPLVHPHPHQAGEDEAVRHLLAAMCRHTHRQRSSMLCSLWGRCKPMCI